MRDTLLNRYLGYSVEELKLRLASSSSWLTLSVAISIISSSTAVFGIIFSIQNNLQSLAEARVTTIVDATGSPSILESYTNFNDYASSDSNIFTVLAVFMAIVLISAVIITITNMYTKSLKYEALRMKTKPLDKPVGI